MLEVAKSCCHIKSRLRRQNRTFPINHLETFNSWQERMLNLEYENENSLAPDFILFTSVSTPTNKSNENSRQIIAKFINDDEPNNLVEDIKSSIDRYLQNSRPLSGERFK